MTDPQGSHRPRRRTVLAGAGALGLAVVASPAVAACAGSGGSAGQSQGPVTVKKSDVPVGGGVIEQEFNLLVVQPTAGDFKAFSSICPHQGCSVDSIKAGVITCPCHGSTFRVADGSVIGGPAPQGLTAMTATVEGADVVVT